MVQSRLRDWAIVPGRFPEDWKEALRAHDNATALLIKEITGLDDVPPEMIKKIRQGNGVEKVESLGIVLNRLNVREIKLKGKLADAAELQAKEERDREAEKVELRHIAERMEELKKLGLSNEEAKELIQTERGKVTKTISETKLNLSPETRDMIEKVIPETLGRIFTPEPEKIVLCKVSRGD